MARITVLAFMWAVLPAQAQSLDGLWRSEGYGLLVQVQGGTVKAFEITSISCMPSWQADGRLNDAGSELVFEHNSCQRRLTLESANVARLRADCSSADILFRRMDASPAGFGRPIENTPQNNYAIFWQTFAENYPFFDLHHIDWSAVDKEFRAKVTAQTSPAELFGLLRRMIEPLHDSHIGLNAADIKQNFRGARPDPRNIGYSQFKKAYEIIASKYAPGPMRYFCNNQLQFTVMDGSIGYLNISQFIGMTAESDYQKQVQALDSALNDIYADAQKLKGLIIDVRFNGGGYDGLGVRIASRLTSEKYFGYGAKTRIDEGEPLRFTPAQSIDVLANKPGFNGKVVLLTSRYTISAAEVFTMSLMGRTPRIIRIGEDTQGVFSDVQPRKLPNGWTFNLPNQIYLTQEGKSFDGTGILPDVDVPVMSTDDLDSNRDPAIEKAIQILGNG